MSVSERARPILEAAVIWKDRCLLGQGSVFSVEPLWTARTFAELDRYFVQNLDEGEGDFFSKLKTQLGPARPETKKLAAEVFWAMYLIVSKDSLRGVTKRAQIRRVWSWSGEELDEDHELLGDFLDDGISHPGMAYNQHRWREFRFFITMMQDWLALDLEQRKNLLEKPWEYAEWLEAREFSAGRQLRHILLHLLFPEVFDRVLTVAHRREIVRAFVSGWDEAPEVDYKDRLSVDRALYYVRERLRTENPDAEVDFYVSPFDERWRASGPGPEVTAATPCRPQLPAGTDAEAWFTERFGAVAVWVISAGEGGRMWPDFRENRIAAIGPDDLGDLSEYASRDSVHSDLAAETDRANPFNDSLALWQFGHEVRAGDVVLVKKGRSHIQGYGVVTGEYRHDPGRAEYANVVDVDWEEVSGGAVPGGHGFTTKALTNVSESKEWVVTLIRWLDGEDLPCVGEARPGPWSIADVMKDLFLSADQFTEILDALARRKNVILQGPPGVGKTFIAKRVAWALMRAKRPDRVEMVQFHQSYAYEDFVQGWRPTETGGFELRDGVFHTFCKRAERHPDEPFVFIIDEINRGNLSRIFGELLMLIESDKRGEEHGIQLTYSPDGERFSVPPNVHLLGMMNTADRSLAMVDYALRRRFAFIGLEPAFETQAFRDYLIQSGADDSLVDLIADRMSELNRKIREDTKNLGPGFEVGHSYFVPTEDDESPTGDWFRHIVRTQVEPLLREYWFDQSEHADRLLDDLEA